MNELQRYVFSLPERSVRASAALFGGLVNETSSIVVPLWVRRSKFYQVTVERLLRITVELIGDVKGVYPPDAMPVEELFVRKTAGNAVEVAGFLIAGWSPIWLLAAASDVVGGTKIYLNALVEELRGTGVLPEDSVIESFEQLLNVLESTWGTLSDAIDIPPLNVSDMRNVWEILRQNVDRIPGTAQLAAIYTSLQTAAQHENRSLLEISSVVAIGATRAGLQLGSTHIFAYYRDALETIANEGLLLYLQRVSLPYLRSIAHHLTPASVTYTDRLMASISGQAVPEEPDPQATTWQPVPLVVESESSSVTPTAATTVREERISIVSEEDTETS